MKITNRSVASLMVVICWGLVSLYSVQLATGILLVLSLIGMASFARDPRAFALKTPEGTPIDKCIGWSVFLYIAISTYPFTQLFVLYVVFELVGSTLLYLTRKEVAKCDYQSKNK